MKATKKFKGMEDKELSFLKKKGASKAMVAHEAKEMKAEKPKDMAMGGFAGLMRRGMSKNAAPPRKSFADMQKLKAVMQGDSKTKGADIRALIGGNRAAPSIKPPAPRQSFADMQQKGADIRSLIKGKIGGNRALIDSGKTANPAAQARMMAMERRGKPSTVNSDDFMARNPKPASFGQAAGMLGMMKGNRKFQQADDMPPAQSKGAPLPQRRSMADMAKAKAQFASQVGPSIGGSNTLGQMLGPKPNITAAGPNPMPGAMKKGGCVKEMATGGTAKANQAKGDLPGSKHFGRSMGEGIEKSYKANTKAVKHRQGDGCAQRGLTKIGRSKEM